MRCRLHVNFGAAGDFCDFFTSPISASSLQPKIVSHYNADRRRNAGHVLARHKAVANTRPQKPQDISDRDEKPKSINRGIPATARTTGHKQSF